MKKTAYTSDECYISPLIEMIEMPATATVGTPSETACSELEACYEEEGCEFGG